MCFEVCGNGAIMSKDIRSFFAKKPRLEPYLQFNNDRPTTPCEESEAQQVGPSSSVNIDADANTTGGGGGGTIPIFDIGRFANRKLTDDERMKVLTETWRPDEDYKFPLLEKFKKRKLYFRHQWFRDYPWLSYSSLEEGAFCIPCVAFSSVGGIGSQPLGQLVKTKFDNWKKAREVGSCSSINPY